MAISPCARSVWSELLLHSPRSAPFSDEELWFAEWMCAQPWAPELIAFHIAGTRRWLRMFFTLKLELEPIGVEEAEVCRRLLLGRVKVEDIVILIRTGRKNAEQRSSDYFSQLEWSEARRKRESQQCEDWLNVTRELSGELKKLGVGIGTWEIEMCRRLRLEGIEIPVLIRLVQKFRNGNPVKLALDGLAQRLSVRREQKVEKG